MLSQLGRVQDKLSLQGEISSGDQGGSGAFRGEFNEPGKKLDLFLERKFRVICEERERGERYGQKTTL